MQKNPKIKLLFSTPKWRIGKPQWQNWSIMRIIHYNNGTLAPNTNKIKNLGAKKIHSGCSMNQTCGSTCSPATSNQPGSSSGLSTKKQWLRTIGHQKWFFIVSYGRSTWRYGVKLNLFYSANLTEWVECNSENQDKVNSAKLYGVPWGAEGSPLSPLGGTLGT